MLKQKLYALNLLRGKRDGAGWGEGAELIHWLGLATLIIILDQITKLWIRLNFVYGESVAVTDFFNLVLVHNSGAAFSFLSNAGGWQRWLFSTIAVTASVWITWLLRKYPQEKLFCFALTLILGGALGNLIDRVTYGYVVDFLDFYWKNYHFPAFNIADSAVTCGAGLFLWDSFTKKT